MLLTTVTAWEGGGAEMVGHGSLGRSCSGAAHRARQGCYKTIPRSGSAATETGLLGTHGTRQLMDSPCPVHGGDR